MKILLAVLLALSSDIALAMKEGVSHPVGTPAALDTSGTNVTASAWVTLIASETYACSALLLHNSGAQPLKVATGAGGSEVELGLVLPIGVSILVPVSTEKAVRLSLKSLGATQSSGIVTVSCFQ